MLAFFKMLNQLGLLAQFGPGNEPLASKGPGHLGLPRVDLEHVASPHSFQTRVLKLFSDFMRSREAAARFLLQHESDPAYTDLLRSAVLAKEFAKHNDQAAALLSELDSDPRIAGLNALMISTGINACIFDKSRFALWYLWCANEFGPQAAKSYLSHWLDADQVEAVHALWVYGLDLDEDIPLANGYCISPAAQLPDSDHKEQALQFRIPTPGQVVSFPTAAVTKNHPVKKTCDASLDSDLDGVQKVHQRLHDIAAVLNAMPGVSCTPAFSSSYSLPSNPYGPFAGSGSGTFIYDVVGRRETKITHGLRDDLLAALGDFDQLTDKERQRFRQILSRLSQGKRRLQIEDKILDLGIALEMLLLRDNPNREQLALTFRLRGAWLVSDTQEERIKNYKRLKDIYSYRSQVAHSGLLEDGKWERIEQVRQHFPEYEALGEKICRRLLRGPSVDWEDIILGGVT